MNAETVKQLMAAIRADCEERTMAQDNYYHSGRFKVPVDNEYDDREFYYDSSLYIDLTTYTGPGKDLTGVWIRIFPDSAHTVKWLQDNGLLTYELVEGNFYG